MSLHLNKIRAFQFTLNRENAEDFIKAFYPNRRLHSFDDITVEETDTRPIGIWGQRRLHYLKHHRKVLYYNLLTSGKLHSHLADTEEQAQELFARLTTDLAKNEGITEELKSADQMAWVRKMNSIHIRVTESINLTLILI